MRNDRELDRENWRTDERTSRPIEYRRGNDQFSSSTDRSERFNSGYSQSDGASYRDRSSFGEHTGKGPRGYQRSDSRILEDAQDALTQDGTVDAREIDVTVSSGEVTLSGTVSTRQEKRAAEDCVERVPGVKDIKNQLQVSSTNGHTSDKMSSDRMTSDKSGESRSSSSKSSREPMRS